MLARADQLYLDLTVSDIKQYLYCPRVVYFTYNLPVRRPITYKMEEGKREHEHAEELEERRTLRAYGLSQGERLFNLDLYSHRLGLSGRLDMAILTSWEAIPVDFKNTQEGPALNHKYQLAAYGLLLEEHLARPVRRGFIYLLPIKEARQVPLTPDTRIFVKELLERIRSLIVGEALPQPTRRRARCLDCEFRNFCNEV
jgi:CRISPR-associated exonuclease Cas4